MSDRLEADREEIQPLRGLVEAMATPTRRSPMPATNPAPVRQELPDLVDITAIAAHLGVEVRHVRRLVAERRIPFIKWGHLLRFDPAEIDTWINDYRHQPRPGTAAS